MSFCIACLLPTHATYGVPVGTILLHVMAAVRLSPSDRMRVLFFFFTSKGWKSAFGKCTAGYGGRICYRKGIMRIIQQSTCISSVTWLKLACGTQDIN